MARTQVLRPVAAILDSTLWNVKGALHGSHWKDPMVQYGRFWWGREANLQQKPHTFYRMAVLGTVWFGLREITESSLRFDLKHVQFLGLISLAVEVFWIRFADEMSFNTNWLANDN